MSTNDRTERNEVKRELRRARWQALRKARAARFPGAAGRIPNFVGAEAAAERLAADPRWRRARVIKCNPDLPQRAVRHRALKEGKRVVVAVPRLAKKRPFLLLDPERIGERSLWHASSIGGALELGRPLRPEDVPAVDLVVVGSVAVAPDGARLGKGGGFADLEYALLRAAGRIGPRTPVVTTVHETQVVAAGEIPMLAHDVALDAFVTRAALVPCRRRHRRPSGVLWKELDAKTRAAIPVLAKGGKGRH
jgi:5-formyltetrahydrofolate cyclo-ligase